MKAVPRAKILPERASPTLIPTSLTAANSSSSSVKQEALAGNNKEKSGNEQDKEEKKDKKAKGDKVFPPAPPVEASDALNPSLLDIRVGTVVKCWNHPDSDKLLCEEVDMGRKADQETLHQG